MKNINETVQSEVTGSLQTTEMEQETHSTVTPDPVGEFKITVRKLEMPVRPRGVLAE
jgi:hypothetical protein